MRLAAQVFLGYFLVLVMGVLWRMGPLDRAIPDVVALIAIYLGLAARERVAPSVLASVVIGYLADLLLGGPLGLLAIDAGVMCLVGHFVQGRLIVRGLVFTAGFAAVVGLVSGLVLLALRAFHGLVGAAVGSQLVTILLSALTSGLAGPIVFRLCRQVDARFARTQRERDAALEGLP